MPYAAARGGDASVWTAPAVVRQPITSAAGRVEAYGARVLLPEPSQVDDPVRPERIARIDAEVAALDLATLTAGQPLVLRATPRLLAGELVAEPGSLVLELPGFVAGRPVTAGLVAQARSRGVAIALGDFTASPAQLALLPDATLVKIDAEHPELAALVAAAHDAGLQTVAERCCSQQLRARAFDAGADLVQTAWVRADLAEVPGELTPGDLPCLELLSLLSEEPVDLDAATGLVATDPALSVRTLRVVNSPAFGLSRPVDSVRRAVVLVGPRMLRAVALSALSGAGSTGVDDQWAILTRAMAVWDLTGDDIGYTVGLLSGVADHRHVPPLWLAALAGVSDDVVAALVRNGGPAGAALAAVREHEMGRPDGTLATGFDPHDVSQAWLAALPESLALAQALSSAA